MKYPTNRIHYNTYGQGKPLVTISGMPSDHKIIASWMEPVFENRSGWQRIYFDLPGTGKSPGANSIKSIDDMLEIVCEFIDSVIPDQPFTLLGLSVGGYLARGVVYRKAAMIDGLCLLVPWLNDNAEQELPQPATFIQNPQVMAQLATDDARKLEGLTTIQNQKIVGWYREVVVAARDGTDWEFMEKIEDNPEYSFDVGRKFEKPTLILTGKQDSHVGYKDAWDILGDYPRATFAVLDCAGHALGVEQETLFRAHINEWLDRMETYQR